MLMQEAREQIVLFGNRLITDRLTQGTAGNISVYDPDQELMAISPSGIPYHETQPEDIVVMDLNGRILDGTRKPSSEYALHSAFYLSRPEAGAVVHAHAMYCTTLACIGQSLKAVHYAIADAQAAEIPLVPYHTFGTQELAEAVKDALVYYAPCRGLLLANHGMCAFGENLKQAYGLALTMEWCAQLQWQCMTAGTPVILTDYQMAEAMNRYKSYGQTKNGEVNKNGYNG